MRLAILKGPIRILVCVLLFASPALAQQASAPTATGRLVQGTITSAALKGNLLGDPAEQSFAVYLPPSYDTSPTRRYPSLYLLHGFLRDGTDWTTAGMYQGKKLQPLMDDMIKSGKIREMIIVAPNAKNAYGGSFYSNSSLNGNWEDYIVRELVENVDAHYRTLARPESRGIAGHSMGGYGAMSLAMKHPDVFSVVYALSPCCLGMAGDFFDNPAWSKTMHLTSRDQLKSSPKSFDEFYELAFVALSAAFSPNPGHAPFNVDFPFEERDGKVVEKESSMALWRSKMPLYLLDDKKENLLKLRGIFLDYGAKEEFSHITITTQLFSKGLAERKIPHIFEVYADGTHVSKVGERVETHVLQFFSARLDFSEPK